MHKPHPNIIGRDFYSYSGPAPTRIAPRQALICLNHEKKAPLSVDRIHPSAYI